MKTLGAMALLGVGMLLAVGCKSAPELTQAQALAMIQAKYDQTPAARRQHHGEQLGMGRGITAGYWKLTRVYPEPVLGRLSP